jgi:glutaredoxin
VALASHLKQTGAKLYGAYWCPYCHKQKALFGNEAFSQLDYVECDPAGKNARPELCQKAHVEGFPTWEIQGKQYGGFRSLQDLADLSGYKGERNFKN